MLLPKESTRSKVAAWATRRIPEDQYHINCCFIISDHMDIRLYIEQSAFRSHRVLL